MIGKGKNKFAEVARAARKGKAIVSASAPPPTWAHGAEEVVVLPHPPRAPTTNDQTATQPESSTRRSFLTIQPIWSTTQRDWN